ncbi:MAG: ubiquinol-cytochrome c reductase iron-sulfur subunit [Acidobacteria bacterium]|nr:ubiquinol-cytochrome c reductase iron-sulfur subunit [Acidobacteriota bacterium]
MPELQNEQELRRGFLVGAIFGLMGAITAALGLPAAGYLLLPGKARRKEVWIEAADLTNLPMNQPEQIIFNRERRDGWKFVTEKAAALVIRTGDQQVVAFSPVCTHLGCAVSWSTNEKHFVCPCHTSAFSTDGKVLGGPAPRPLDRFDVKIAEGKVLLGEVRESKES